jgi:hypothetical protein
VVKWVEDVKRTEYAMASQGFTKPSTGQDFTTPSNGYSNPDTGVTDAFSGQSMAGGNATTGKTQETGGATGSDSEGTALVEAAAIHDFGDLGVIKTALSAPATPDDQTSTKISG